MLSEDAFWVLSVFILSILLSCFAFFAYELREKRKSQLQLIQYKRRTAREGIVDFGISREEADQVTRYRYLVRFVGIHLK
jgi:hypothetical protein